MRRVLLSEVTRYLLPDNTGKDEEHPSGLKGDPLKRYVHTLNL
jgi:hypothetical protein